MYICRTERCSAGWQHGWCKNLLQNWRQIFSLQAQKSAARRHLFHNPTNTGQVKQDTELLTRSFICWDLIWQFWCIKSWTKLQPVYYHRSCALITLIVAALSNKMQIVVFQHCSRLILIMPLIFQTFKWACFLTLCKQLQSKQWTNKIQNNTAEHKKCCFKIVNHKILKTYFSHVTR